MEVEEVISYISDFLGISSSILEFPDFILFLIIPYIVVAYVLYDFLKKLRIFQRANFVNGVFAIIICFVLLRFVYPTMFLIAILYLLFLKRTQFGFVYGRTSIIIEILIKVLFLGLLAFLYMYLLPYLSSLPL